jgi:hypothetical protein
MRGLFLVILATIGCSGAAKQPVLEDEARTLSPVPACIVRLPSRAGRAGTLRTLREQQYWEVVFDNFDAEKKSVPADPRVCTGRHIFQDKLFEGAKRLHPYPEPITEEDILVGGGGDRLKVVWLKTHTASDGLVAGTIALVRAKESVAEIYAIGAYKAATKRPYFVVERMGNEALVTVRDEACVGVKPGTACENQVSIFVPRKGVLAPLGMFATEKRAFAAGFEQGAPGMIEYRLQAAVSYLPTGVKVFEQAVARDPEGRELRKAEIERVFAFREVELVTEEPALWPRFYPEKRGTGEQ